MDIAIIAYLLGKPLPDGYKIRDGRLYLSSPGMWVARKKGDFLVFDSFGITVLYNVPRYHPLEICGHQILEETLYPSTIFIPSLWT